MVERLRFTSDGAQDTQWSGGKGIIHVTGTFGGGTVKMLTSMDGESTYLEHADGIFTSEASKLFTLANRTRIRIELTGATSPDLTISLDKV